MSNRPPLNWNSVRRDLTSDRLTLKPVREDRLRPNISAWRGNSGRRYVFSIDKLAGFDTDEAIGALALFITRDASGIASIACGLSDPDRIAAAAACEAADQQGCLEVHLHRLSDADDHAAILADLSAPVMEAA